MLPQVEVPMLLMFGEEDFAQTPGTPSDNGGYVTMR
jgi:hypothetical protein